MPGNVSIACVCVCVRLSACNSPTIESLDLQSLFLNGMQVRLQNIQVKFVLL